MSLFFLSIIFITSSNEIFSSVNGKFLSLYFTYKPNLPTHYSKKPTLTYFITILYSKNSNFEFKVANINVGCMPNGSLKNIYLTTPLGPGKNIGQARFMMANCYEFKKLVNEGFFLRNTHYNFTPTYTGPGHASIFTGTTPSVHGIIGNNTLIH